MAPSSSVPSLPPSVEEAYKRKCVNLKQRMAEVEETNDAARVRIARLKRQVEKQRLERAFLLEQLAKRTSTNVEDSDGSPSPPPTPKDKPLRTKRGHRKPSVVATADAGTPAPAGATFINQGSLQALSPTSDTFSHNPDSKKNKDGKDSAKPPSNGFELYCAEMRPSLEEKKEESGSSSSKKKENGDVDMADADEDKEDKDEKDAPEAVDVDAELARGWTEMSQAQKDEFEARVAEEQAKHKKAEEARQQKKDEEETGDREKDKEEQKDKESKGGDDADKEEAEKKDKKKDDDKEAEATDKKESEKSKDGEEKKAEEKDKEESSEKTDKAEDKKESAAAPEKEAAFKNEDTEMADADTAAEATPADKE